MSVEKNYAFIKDGRVVNVVVFDSDSQNLITQFIEKFSLDEIVEAPVDLELDSTWDGIKFRSPIPFASWTYNDEIDCWEAPVRRPFMSWQWDESTLAWQAPIPYPTDGKDYEWEAEIDTWVEVVKDNQ